jgi:hypothetical protein
MAVIFLFFLTLGIFFGAAAFIGAPYVPTKGRLLEGAFKSLYPLSKKDVLVDIGSGDGLVLRKAAAYGARAVGYEINPILFLISKCISRSPLISTRLADYRLVTFPKETTIIYTFGDSRDIERMYRKAEETAIRYQKNLYFMTFGFHVPKKEYIKKNKSFYLYYIRYLHQG